MKQQTIHSLALSPALAFLLAACGASPPKPPAAGNSGDIKEACPEDEFLAECDPNDNPGGGGGGETKPPDPLPPGFMVTEHSVAAGNEICVKGGDQFVTFYDANGNDIQDANEDTVQKHYFCPKRGNPLPEDPKEEVEYKALGLEEALKLGDSPCIFGGRKLTVFIDLNSNMAFDGNEPSQEVVHCNAVGSSTFKIHDRNSAAGFRSLPVGHSECENGGAEIFSFIDIDENGKATDGDFAFEVNYLCLSSETIPTFHSSEVARIVGKGDANCPADGGIELQRPLNDKKTKKLYTCSNPDFGPAPVAKPFTGILRRGETRVQLDLDATDPNGSDIPDKNFIIDPPPADKGTLQGNYPNLYFVAKDDNFRGRVKFSYHVVSESGARSKDATITIIVQRAVLLVSDLSDGSMFPSDQVVVDQLQQQGAEVSFAIALTEDAAPERAEGFDLLVISENVNGAHESIRSLYRDLPMPIMILEPALFDFMNLSAVPTRADVDGKNGYWLGDNGVTINPASASHTMAAGLRGTFDFIKIPKLDDLGKGKVYGTGGIIGRGAKVIATLSDHKDYASIFIYESGAEGWDGTPVPGKRIGFGGAFLTEYTTKGLTLLKAAITEALQDDSE